MLRYPGQSWIALGWKSPEATCDLSAADFVNRHVASSASSSTTSSSFSTSTISSIITNATSREQNDAGDRDCGPNEQWSECPESSRECEHSCDWTHFPETTPNCPNSCGQARCICKEGFVRMANEEDVCVPFDFCDKTVENEESCAANSTWAKCGTACEPTCANMYDTAPCPASCEKPGCTCADNYVRHNGKCIYWGDCPELRDEKTTTKETVETTQSTIDRNEITQASEVTKTKATTQKVIVSECSLNETLNECGRVCEADCVSIFTRSECSDCGSAACACLQGYARNPQGQCVYWGDCPTDGTPLTFHEVYTSVLLQHSQPAQLKSLSQLLQLQPRLLLQVSTEMCATETSVTQLDAPTASTNCRGTTWKSQKRSSSPSRPVFLITRGPESDLARMEPCSMLI